AARRAASCRAEPTVSRRGPGGGRRGAPSGHSLKTDRRPACRPSGRSGRAPWIDSRSGNERPYHAAMPRISGPPSWPAETYNARGSQKQEHSVPVSERTFQQLALDEPGQWELVCGNLRRKPAMTFEHNNVAFELAYLLRQQLDRTQFHVRASLGHVRRTSENYFIPDVFAIPIELTLPLRGLRNVLEAYDAPLPLVVEV